MGGLSWDTDDEALKAHFAQFGEVLESVVVYNKTAGISRGFGFVTYVGMIDTPLCSSCPNSNFGSQMQSLPRPP